MSQVTIERRRSGIDVLVGILLVVAGLYILGNVVLATAFTALFIGWWALVSGLIELIGSLFKIKSGNFWSHALGGVVLTVFGIVVLRNPAFTVVILTIMAGAMFLSTGLMRVIMAAQVPASRWAFILSGLISIALGLLVLFNLVDASFALLGTLLGVQTLVEGLTIIMVGRLRKVTSDE
ncbi:MAG: DUF308 domain-containing protein [Actinomycetota bacterium]|nr:DUF308 domain-containing protein [Actinomycetota bacterium]